MGLSTDDLVLFVILPGVCLVVLLTLAVWIWLKFCRNRDRDRLSEPLLERSGSSTTEIRNRIYSMGDIGADDSEIIDEVSLVERVKYEQQIHSNELRESAFIFMQFWLRSNKQRNLQLIEHLPVIGSRIDKNWFLMKQIFIDGNNKSALIKLKLLSMLKKSKATRTLVNTPEQVKMLNELFVSLKHPCVLTYDLVHIDYDQSYMILLGGYSKEGTLKDIIYKIKSPIDEWSKKYQYKTNGLPIKQVKIFLRQILSALLYLKLRNMPPITDLHSGNIIMGNEKKTCLVSGYENIFLGLDGRLTELFRKNSKKLSTYALISNPNKKYDELSQIKEILCFAHLAYEMCAGCELKTLTPLPNDYKRFEAYYNYRDNEEIIKLLNYIFYNQANDQTSKKHMVPSLQSITTIEFFNDASNVGQNVEFNDISQSNDLKSFIDLIVQKTKQTNAKPTKAKLRNATVIEGQTKSNPAGLAPMELSKPTISGPPPPAPPLPPPSLAPAPAVKLENPPETSSDRNALLESIRHGRNLKKTKTVDKSKPKLR
jgi:hypothetical protein